MLRWGVGAVIGAALAALQAGPRHASAQALPAGTPLRIGLIVPNKTGPLAVDAAQFDIVGDAARVGWLLADGEVAQAASSAGLDYRLLPANAPSAEAALRAAQRLVALEEVTAIVGGLGEGQAEVLADFANEHGLPFFNVGSSADRLRDACDPGYVFHVEASQAMFLDGLVAWHAAQGRRRWFLIDDAAYSGGVAPRLATALERHGRGGVLVGSAVVRDGQPLYSTEAQAAVDAEADVVLISVAVRDEILLRYTLSDTGTPWAVAALPTTVTQTRDFIAASRVPTPEGVADQRLLTWEATLRSDRAGSLNDRGNARAGQPFDPSGWATYQAIHAYHQAVVESGSIDAAVVRRTLTDPSFELDSVKGTQLGFRPWDQQLRQPMYMVDVDHTAAWGMLLSQRLSVARLAGVLPDEGEDLGPDLLDRFGDGPSDRDPC